MRTRTVVGRTDVRSKVALAGVLALVMGLLVAGAPARAADGGSGLWTRRYDGPASGDDYVTGMAASPDGSRLFVTGFGPGLASGNDYATVAYDASTGTRLWTRRYDGPARAQDAAEDVAVSPDGSTVFVTGNSRGVTSGSDIVTIAYAAVSGTTRWTARYDGPAGTNDEGVAVVPGPYGGTVFVTGWSGGTAHGADYATLAYSTATGVTRWIRRYSGPGVDWDIPAAITTDPEGATIFVTGWSTGPGGDLDYATVAYAGSGGALRWSRRYDGPVGLEDRATAIGATPNASSVFVTGVSEGGTGAGSDYATLAYRAWDGATRWVRRYNGPTLGGNGATALSVSPFASAVFVTGTTNGGATSPDYGTVAYQPSTGETIWKAAYDGIPGPGGTDDGQSVSAGFDGATVYVTGTSQGTGSDVDLATVSYGAADGEQGWSARYDGPAHGFDQMGTVVASPDGTRVFVTGWSAGIGTGEDIVVIAYAA